MSLLRSSHFIADVERQYEWDGQNAGWDLAEHYLASVQATCQLLERHPLLGPVAGFSHTRLRGWRFVVVLRPFRKHVLFYELTGNDVVMRRVMHGNRNLPDQLMEPPGAR